MEWLTAGLDGKWGSMSGNVEWCTPGKGAIPPPQLQQRALSWLWSLRLLWVQCEHDRSIWRMTDSFVKTPAQCLATLRKANDRLTILRQGIENRRFTKFFPFYKSTLCLLFHVLNLQPVKGPLVEMVVWNNIHIRNIYVPQVSPEPYSSQEAQLMVSSNMKISVVSQKHTKEDCS